MINPLILDRKSRVPKSQLHDMVNEDLQNLIFEFYDKELGIKKDTEDLAELLSAQYQKDKNPKILNMKRDIFNKRVVKVKNGLSKYGYPESLENYINQILTRIQKQEELYETIKVNYNLQINRERKALQSAFRNFSDLSNPMLLWNMDMYHKLNKYMEKPYDQHGNDLRKIDFTLMKALSRTCMKTSPFSTLTKVGQAIRGNESDYCPGEDMIKTRINYTFLYKIIFNILEKEERLYRVANYTLSPHAFVEKNGQKLISYVAHVDKEDAQKVYKTSEVLYEFKIIPALKNFFAGKTLSDPITFEEIHDVLSSVSEENTEDITLKILKKYVQVGLLNYRIGFKEESEDLIGEVLNKVKPYMEQDTYVNVSDAFNNLRGAMETLENVSGFKDKYDAMKTVEHMGTKLCDMAGVEFNRKNLFYEDGICTEVNTISNSVIENNIDNMRLLQEFTLLFDINFRLKYELGERLHEKYGYEMKNMESDFFQIVFAVSKDMGVYWRSPLETFKGARSKVVRMMDDLKIQFYKELNSLYQANHLSESIDLTDLIKKYVGMIPEEIKTNADMSTSYFFQLNDDKFIVNGVYEGQEKFKARFLDYFEDRTSTEEYSNYTSHYYDAQNYHEFLDSFGFNGNIKRLTLGKECITLGTGMRRFTTEGQKDKLIFEECQIKVSESYHGIEFFNKEKEKIKVVMRGSLVPTAMPGYFSFISQLFVTGRLLFKMGDLVDAATIPRFTLGNMVLSRKRIRLSEHFTSLKKLDKEDDLSYFMRLNKYFKEHDLPDCFFITFKRNKDTMGEVIQNFKPLYVDIKNILLVKILNKEVINRNYSTNFFIEEVLGNTGEFVEEFEIEISKREGMCRAV